MSGWEVVLGGECILRCFGEPSSHRAGVVAGWQVGRLTWRSRIRWLEDEEVKGLALRIKAFVRANEKELPRDEGYPKLGASTSWGKGFRRPSGSGQLVLDEIVV